MALGPFSIAQPIILLAKPKTAVNPLDPNPASNIKIYYIYSYSGMQPYNAGIDTV
jgi:hypothetical protein